MKKKNLLMMLFVLAATVFHSCDSDDSNGNPAGDDNTPGETSALIGTWKALMIYYTEGGNEYPMHFSNSFYRICEVADYLTLSESAVAKLTETLDNDDEVFECNDVIKTGSWTETKITITGESAPREIISATETTLTLKYPDNSYHGLGVIKVQYTKQ